MGRLHTKTFKNGTWSNTIGHYSSTPKKFAEPKDHDEIAAFIREAEREDKKIRAVGSGHAFSNAAITKDGNYLIHPYKLNAVRPVVDWVLKEEHQNTPLVWVQSGVTVRNLNKELDTLGYSITNMGGIDHQTISGAISTGTHGTGIDVPAIHGMVRAIQLVTHGGEKLQLENSAGISNDDLTYNGDFKIVRNDETFNAAVVSLGAMGIIYAYILKVEYEYWLKEVNKKMTWKEIKSLLGEGDVLKQYRGVKILINPYNLSGEEDGNTCILSTHEILYKPKKTRFSDSFRNFISSIFSNWAMIRALGFSTIKRFTEKCPEKMPKVIETAVKNLKDNGYINTAHKVLHQGGEYAKERAYDCELSFDAKNNGYIKVVDAILKQAAKLQKEAQDKDDKTGYFHTSPISFRFVQKSNAFLVPEYDRNVCSISIPAILNNRNDAAKKLDTFLKEGLTLMLNKNGAPHWGKINSLLIDRKEELGNLYPGLEKWKKALKNFHKDYNKDNRKTFNSNLIEELDLVK